MATVTEHKMAIALAREGGLGIIHQFSTMEEQFQEVKKVKRSTSYVIEDPVTINENADSDVTLDIITALDRVIPWVNRYKHFEGNSAAHIKASMMGFSVSIPVEKRKLVFGTWQCIYFCEFDGPRSRNVVVTITGS